VLPLIGRVSLGVGAISYAGQFKITAVADGDAYPTSTSSPPASGTSRVHSQSRYGSSQDGPMVTRNASLPAL
jgi:hypothetical protein